MDKKMLLIDDNDQKDVLNDIVDCAKSKGINLIYYQFNVGGHSEPDLLTDGAIDIHKVKVAYKERFKDKGIVFNLIACDWGLSDDNIDGAELLRQMGTECFEYDTPRILYSGLLREKLKERLDQYRDDNKDKVLKYLQSLINSNYLAFIQREKLKETILSHIKNSENLDFLLLDILGAYPEKRMAVGHNHNLTGKTFAEVAYMIKNDDTVNCDFKRNIIQEVTHYLTVIQSKKQ